MRYPIGKLPGTNNKYRISAGLSQFALLGPKLGDEVDAGVKLS
jgi:hypothetical protein